MHRSIHSLIGVVTAATLALWPLAGSAQEVASGPRDLTPDQVQAAFIRADYEVESAIYWGWTSPPLTTFRVRDAWFDRRSAAELPKTDRVLMVLVYPDAATALAARQRADASAEADQQRSLVLIDQHGPRLVPGYGESVWRGNVALVQSSPQALSRLYAAELVRDMFGTVIAPSVVEPAVEAPTYAVDPDFLALMMDVTLFEL